MHKLDRNRGFGTVVNHEAAMFYQDGRYFDGAGNEVILDENGEAVKDAEALERAAKEASEPEPAAKKEQQKQASKSVKEKELELAKHHQTNLRAMAEKLMKVLDEKGVKYDPPQMKGSGMKASLVKFIARHTAD